MIKIHLLSFHGFDWLERICAGLWSTDPVPLSAGSVRRS